MLALTLTLVLVLTQTLPLPLPLIITSNQGCLGRHPGPRVACGLEHPLLGHRVEVRVRVRFAFCSFGFIFTEYIHAAYG